MPSNISESESQLLQIHKELCKFDFLSNFDIEGESLFFKRNDILFEIKPFLFGFQVARDNQLVVWFQSIDLLIKFFDPCPQ